MIDSIHARVSTQKIHFQAEDGYVLGGYSWRHREHLAQRAVVVINPATSVLCRYYSRFAEYLYNCGFDVLTYDYRGIGLSRPARLRGFEAGWIDWGRLDFEAALQYVIKEYPEQPIHVVAHSVGGFLVGLAPSNPKVRRIFTMGAQYAYWKDYAPERRNLMFLKWHVVMPAMTAVLGYFPGKRLGWLEDTPKGVVRDWTSRSARFEDTWRKGSLILGAKERLQLVERFAAVRAEILSLGVSDDEFGTMAASHRLLAYFVNSRRMHIHMQPQAVGQSKIGHFSFFHHRFERSLWPIVLEWLRHGRLHSNAKGSLSQVMPGAFAAQ